MLRGSNNKRNTYNLLSGILSNYCGPGGYASMLPKNAVDVICKEHDANYDKIIELGLNPYIHYNWADQIMEKKLKQLTPNTFQDRLIKDVASSLWNAKRQYTQSLSDLPSSETTPPVVPKKRKATDSKATPAKKKLAMGNLRRPEVIDEDMEDNSKAMVLSSDGSPGVSSGKSNQETDVIYHQPSWGLPETHTTILPMTAYFSCARLNHGDATESTLKLRMTTPLDSISSTINDNTAGSVPASKVIGDLPLYWDGAQACIVYSPAGIQFPKKHNAEIPAYRDYFEKIYESYHVIGCHWRLTVANVTNYADITIATAYESWATGSGNEIPNNITLDESYAYQGFEYHNVSHKYRGSRSDTLVITGSYKPGQCKTNVKNDEDVKTWTQVGSLPSLSEILKIYFWRAPLSGWGELSTGCNCMLEVKYIVQYKDLKIQARYPQSAQTVISQSFPMDILQKA